MGINKVMTNALRSNWTLTDDFQFTFSNAKRPLTSTGSEIPIQEIIDISVMNIDLPQLGSAAESVMQAGEWRIYNAKFEPFSFSVTFRDFGSLDLRSYFSAVWMDAQRGYFNKVKSSIDISIKGELVFQSDDCLITAVSQVQLDNASSQIAEFTVEFSSPYYTNAQIKKFGSDEYDTATEEKTTTELSAGATGISSTISKASSTLSSLQGIVSKISNF